MPTVQVLVKGKVQGVFYRAGTKQRAEELGISGWVRNTAEGHVEIMATGAEEALQTFVEWCRQGPATARVTSLLVTNLPAQRFQNFLIKRE